MEMFKTRKMILDGAKAATNMSKIRDITWNHENIQREWAKVKIIAKTKIRIKMRLHILPSGFREGQWCEVIAEPVNDYDSGIIA